MKIRALANGNVIHADDEAAKILIDAKIYEAVDDKEPLTASLAPPVPNSLAEAKPAKRRKTR